MVDLMKNIVGNLKLISAKIMSLDIRMDNVYQNNFTEIVLALCIVLMQITNG
jgi:hypothetical protein